MDDFTVGVARQGMSAIYDLRRPDHSHGSITNKHSHGLVDTAVMLKGLIG